MLLNHLSQVGDEVTATESLGNTENFRYLSVWVIAKVILRGTFIALNPSIIT